MLEVQEVTTAEGLAGLGAEWDRLYAAGGLDNAFLTHRWMSAWWKHFGRGRQLLILLVKDGPETIGIVPWMVQWLRPWMPLRRIQFVGTGLSDRLDAVLPARRAEQLECVLDHLEGRKGAWEMVDLHEIPPESDTTPILEDLLSRRRVSHCAEPASRCPYIPIREDWSTYYARIKDAETRRANRRKLRKLEGQGRVAIRRRTDLGGDAPVLEQLRGMPQRGTYRGERRVSLFDGGARAGFFEEITAWLAETGDLDLWTAELSGKLIAYRFGWRDARRHYDYFAGYDPDYSPHSPGTLLLLRVLEDCFESGLREFDFLRGEEPYKLEWTGERRQNHRIRFFARSLRGTLLRMAHLLRDRPGQR
jgi:CelD/BcsL family acetyltransferase involved in cellulose biosynthesis